MSAALLVTPVELDADVVVVEGDDHRHLFRARRLGPGDPVRVTDGGGRQRAGCVEAVDRRTARLRLGDWTRPPSPVAEVTVVVGTPRAERARWLVEKLTELGVVAIRFVQAGRTNHRLGRGVARLERVAKSALLQSGGARLPRIVESPLDDAADDVRHDRPDGLLLLSPGAPESLPEVIRGSLRAGGERIVVFLGPEGGFTEAEERALLALGATAAHLGPLVLRVETAATVAAGVILAG